MSATVRLEQPQQRVGFKIVGDAGAAVPAPEERPVQPEQVRPRRVTGASLVRRLLTKPGLTSRLKDPRVVPLGSGKAVLGAVAGLIAAWDRDGLYDEHVSQPALTPDGLEGRVIEKLRLTNSAEAVAQVKDVLAKLQAAELIELGPDGVRLSLPPLPVIEVADTQAAVASNADPENIGNVGAELPTRPGCPLKGEPTSHYQQRTTVLRQAREHVQLAKEGSAQYRHMTERARSMAQVTMMLPISGGKAESAEADIAADVSRAEVSEEVASQSQAEVDFAHGAAAADLESSISNSGSAAASRAREHMRGDISNMSSSDIAEADHFARDLISMFGWRMEKTGGIVGEVRQWFARGIRRLDLEPKLREVHDRHLQDRRAGLAGVRSVNYLTKAFAEILGSKSISDRLNTLPPRREAMQPQPTAPVTMDPRLPDMAVGDRMWAVRALERLDRLSAGAGLPEDCPSSGSEAVQAVSLARSYCRVAFDAVVMIYPQVAGWFGEGIPTVNGQHFPHLVTPASPPAAQQSRSA